MHLDELDAVQCQLALQRLEFRPVVGNLVLKLHRISSTLKNVGAA